MSCETGPVGPLPFAHPVAAVVFWVAYGLFITVELNIAVRSRIRGWGRPAELDEASKRTVVLSIVAAFFVAFWAATTVRAATIAASEPILRWVLLGVGVMLMLLGTGLRQWAIHTLGRFFTLEVRAAVNQRVVDVGPYRLVRHPSYTGALLAFAGIGLALGNWLSLVVSVFVPLLGFLRRIAVEERVLVEQLGEPYRRYAATRRRLVPGLW